MRTSRDHARPPGRPGPGRTRAAGALLAALLAIPAAARAEVFLEPEAGVRAYTSTAADLLAPGLVAGGTLGVHATPVLALTAHGSMGFHEPGDEQFEIAFEKARSLVLLAGLRVRPMGAHDDRAIQPFVGGAAGLGILTLEYTDFVEQLSGHEDEEVRATLLAAEAGADVRWTEAVGFVLAARLVGHRWNEESNRDATVTHEGHTFEFLARLRFAFR